MVPHIRGHIWYNTPKMKRSKSPNTLITAHVRRLKPYVPGEQPASKRVVKLNTNENPYPPSPMCEQVLKGFDLDRLRRYPDPVFAELRGALAALAGVEPERVFVGNGSDEILSLLSRAFVEDGESIGSLAGMRVGWCVGPKDLIEALYKVKDSYNFDAIAQAVALAAIRDQEWMRSNVRRIVAARNRFTAALKARGWDVLPSESNFVFARPPKTQRAAKPSRPSRRRTSSCATSRAARPATGSASRSGPTPK